MCVYNICNIHKWYQPSIFSIVFIRFRYKCFSWFIENYKMLILILVKSLWGTWDYLVFEIWKNSPWKHLSLILLVGIILTVFLSMEISLFKLSISHGLWYYPCLAVASFSGVEKVNLTQRCEKITQNLPQVAKGVAELWGPIFGTTSPLGKAGGQS